MIGSGGHPTDGDVFPLSPLQAAMLARAQAGDGAAYQDQIVLHLRGAIDAELLAAAWNTLVERHEALRACFLTRDDGPPVQAVLRRRPLVLRQLDLSALDPAAQAGELARLRREERERPFDLRREPTLRLLLCRLAAERQALLWTFHHIALDGWSKGVLLDELATVIAARWRRPGTAELQLGSDPGTAELQLGLSAGLPPAVPYRRFVRAWADRDPEVARGHWRRELAGLAGPTGLPASAERSSDGYRVEELTMTLEAPTTAALRALGAARGLTPSALLQAAWGVVLARQSGRDDVVFGTVSAGRDGGLEGVERAVGLFVQTLPVRLRPAPGDTLVDLAQRVQRATLAAAGLAPLSLAEIARAAGLQRVVDHLLDVVNYPFDLTRMLALGAEAGFAIEKVEALDQSELDLNLFARFDEVLRLDFNYDGEVYRRDHLEAVGEHLLDLLRDAVEAPRRPLGERALLSRRERGRLAAARLAALPPPGEGRRQPLSPHQERLWFIDRFERGTVYPAAPTYHNVPLLLRLRGPLDAARLQAALGALARRHQALGLRFGSRDGVPFQELDPRPALPLERLPPADDARSAEAAALAAAARPFELDGGPLVAASLVTAGDDGHLLVLALHHAIVDRASLDLLARDLAELYAGTIDGDAPPAGPGFLAVAAWEREALGAVEEVAMVGWRRHLAALPVLVVPTDRPRAAVHTYTAQRTPFAVPPALAARLRALAAGEAGAPRLEAWLLAGFAALLARYGEETDVVVGTSDPRRGRPDLAGIVGPLANLLVLRLAVTPAASFAALAAGAAAELAGVRERGDVPFDRLVTALAPQKDMSRTALFDVCFGYEEVDPRLLPGGELTFERLETGLGWGKYDLALTARAAVGDDGAVELAGELVSNRDHHDEATARRFVEHFLTLLDRLAASPVAAIGGVSCSSEEERRMLVAESRPAPVLFPRAATLEGLFAEQAARAPDAVAVVSADGDAGDLQLSYGGLANRVRALAGRLRRQGVGAESRVALLLERDAELVVGMLAALEAGGAYVPLDPDFPRERLQLMVEDAGVALVVTTSALAERLAPAAAGDRAVAILRVDGAEGDPNPESEGGSRAAPTTGPEGGSRAAPTTEPPPSPRALPGNLAYVIYTSGSTGRPKGVMVERRQVVRLIRHEAPPYESPLFDFGPTDVWTLFHSASFDFSVWEVFAPLLTGGRLVVVPKATARDAEAFLELLAERRVTVLNQTPSAFANLARVELAGGGPPPQSLRTLIFGGEALQPRSLADWMAAHPEVAVVNMYGITETTVHVTFKRIGPAEVAGNVSNVGRAIPTLATVLLDPRMELVSAGVAGELCVAGEGVTRGYLGRPGLTADRFRPHPFGDGDRLYRSGDRARRLAGGDLLYLGRGDHQVKVRGFRIEPGEIEHRLLEHPQVSAAAVLAVGSGERTQLVAHVVAPPELSVEALRSHLAERLPEHMVPARFVRLGALPLTPTGKTDRRALAALPAEELELGNRFVAPRDAREEALAASWSAVLGRERIGVHDSYFALGGDSIRAIQVASRLLQRGLRLRIQDLFQHPTIATLAPRLTPVEPAAEPAATGMPSWSSAVPGPDAEEIPLTPIQRWFFDAFAAEPRRFAHPVVLRLTRRYPAAVVERALQAVVDAHPALAYTFERQGGRWAQRPGRAPVRLAIVEARPGVDPREEVQRLAVDRLAALDPAVSPLQAALLGGADADRLLLLVHHLVVDGVSWRILLEDLAVALGQAGRDQPVTLPPELTSFARWATASARESPRLPPEEEAYWRRVEKACRPLPVDFPAGGNRFADGAEGLTRLPAELSRLLLGPANRAYRTSPEDLLLAALARALRAWPGGGPWVLTLEGHGRAALAGELGRTVGWLTCRHPFALELAGDDDGDAVGSTVKRVKEALRRVPAAGTGYPRSRYPAVGPVDPPPVPPISFNYLGEVDLALAGDVAGGGVFALEPGLGWEAAVDGAAPRLCDLDLSAVALGGRLELRLGYSRARLRAATVAALAERWQAELRIVAEHCATRPAEVTPADLSYAGIAVEDLEGIVT